MARKRSSTLADRKETNPPVPGAANGPGRSTPRPVGARNVDENEIRNLAYRKWEEAGCPDEDGVRFWLAAERELQSS